MNREMQPETLEVAKSRNEFYSDLFNILGIGVAFGACFIFALKHGDVNIIAIAVFLLHPLIKSLSAFLKKLQ